MMMICTAMGSLQSCRIERKEGHILFMGREGQIEFFGEFGEGYMTNLPAEINVHCETHGEPRPGPREMHSAAWLRYWPEHGRQKAFYHLELMLNEADHEFFATMARRHLGQKIEYAFSFEVREANVTQEEFLGGKNLFVKDAAIEIAFSTRP